MNERDKELAKQAGWPESLVSPVIMAKLKEFADSIRADEREKVAAWMMQRGYATGHGDTIEDLLQELDWQVAEREREACAKVCEEVELHFNDRLKHSDPRKTCAAAIRARGNT